MITQYEQRIISAAVSAAEHAPGGQREAYLAARRAAIVAWRRATGGARLPELAVRHCEILAVAAACTPRYWGVPCWPDGPDANPAYWPREERDEAEAAQ